VCTREEDYRERYRQPDKLDAARDTTGWPAPYWHVDAGAAAMLVELAAINEGLGASVFGVPVERAQPVRELLKLPDDIAIVEVLALGWPAKDTVSDQVSIWRRCSPARGSRRP
jgi:nitroreductase